MSWKNRFLACVGLILPLGAWTSPTPFESASSAVHEYSALSLAAHIREGFHRGRNEGWLSLTNACTVSQYAWQSLSGLGRVKSVEDVAVLYDFAERIGEIRNRIVSDYRRMPPIIGIRFASEAARKRHERRTEEDGLQIALRDAKKIMTFMVIAQCDASFGCEWGSPVWTNILNGVAERARFSEYERKCLFEFHERGEYPRDEPVYKMEMLTDEEMRADEWKELQYETNQ